jgi:AbrB family looped-hinge helix DNA binding protein
LTLRHIPGILEIQNSQVLDIRGGMMAQSLTRVVQLPARGQITIPTEFRRRLGLEDGALLRMRLTDDRIEIEPLATAEAGLRLYTDEELRQFQAEDKIDAETAAAVRRLLAAGEL